MSAMSLRRCCAGPPESAVPSRSVLPGVDDGGHVCAVSSVKSVHAIRPGTVYGAGHRGLLSPFSRTRWMMRVPWFDRLLVAAAAVACVVLVASPLPAQQGAAGTEDEHDGRRRGRKDRSGAGRADRKSTRLNS